MGNQWNSRNDVIKTAPVNLQEVDQEHFLHPLSLPPVIWLNLIYSTPPWWTPTSLIKKIKHLIQQNLNKNTESVNYRNLNKCLWSVLKD